MTAYEFTRFTADYTNRVKSIAYDVRTVELQIAYNSDHDLREDHEYEDAYDMFMECTMSCDSAEALQWCGYWMRNAIAYGIETKDLDWRHKFLAAKDLLEHTVDDIAKRRDER